jgi:hypothetical protein
MQILETETTLVTTLMNKQYTFGLRTNNHEFHDLVKTHRDKKGVTKTTSKYRIASRLLIDAPPLISVDVLGRDFNDNPESSPTLAT